MNRKYREEEMEHNNETIYAIIVYGFVPEFMPHVAFRRNKHFKTEGKKEIKCPYCGELFKIVAVTAKLELMRYPKKTTAKVPWHKSEPCSKCHNLIGIIYEVA